METENIKEVLMFTCPECGSHKFGTNNCLAEDAAEMTGECHGTLQRYGAQRAAVACTFQWSRADDAKYFTGTGDLMSVSSAIGAGREVDG